MDSHRPHQPWPTQPKLQNRGFTPTAPNGPNLQEEVDRLEAGLSRPKVAGSGIFLFETINVQVTLPETDSSPLKMDGWNTIFLLGRPIFRGYVSFRECSLVFFFFLGGGCFMDGFGDWGCWMLCICSKVPTNDAIKLFGDGKVYMRTAKQFELI